MDENPTTRAADSVAAKNPKAEGSAEATTFATPPGNPRPPEIRFARLDQLQPHPSNPDIYGDGPSDVLVDSIKAHGVQQPLLVTQHKIIVSGHLRHAASKAAGLKEVPVIEVHAENEFAEIEMLVTANSQRVKTHEQVAREAHALMQAEQARARQRQATAAGGKAVPAISPEPKGDARTIVAEKLHIGRKRVDHAVAVIEKLNQLDADGKTSEAKEIRRGLEKSINRAYQKVKLLAVPVPAHEQPPIAELPKQEKSPSAHEKDKLIVQLDRLKEEIEKWPIEKRRLFEADLSTWRTTWETAYLAGEEAA